MFVDGIGNIYIADASNHRIRRVNTTRVISTMAGSAGGYSGGYSGDGGPATSAQFSSPQGVFVDGIGNTYIADTGNSRIRKVNTSGFIFPLAVLS